MSFGFDVGNFADAAHLAYLIYRDCYKVARGAPQEFQLLVSEVSTLSSSLKILQEDVKDPESPLLQAGDDRVKLVNDMVENIRVTLNKMEKVARKYEIMGSTTASKGKQMWTRFKWTFDWSTIEKLREKLNQHNTMMSLLLTQIGNSSLQKIQSSTNALESDIHEIRKHIAAQQGGKLGNQEGSKGTPIPFLSFEHDEFLVKDDTSRSSLSASLLRHAEVHQPWSTVGVSQWIETGTWWLLRAQLDIRPIVIPGSTIPKPAYANLIKASWILTDIIACHPQIAFVSSSTRAQITALSTQIKQVFEKLKMSDLNLPILEDIGPKDLYIWEASESKGLLLRPQLASSASALSTLWTVEGDEQALFMKIAECNLTASGSNICIVLFLAQQDGRATRIVAKRQNGTLILDIPFTKPVTLEVASGAVVVNGQNILLDDKKDMQHLFCLVQAANIYLFQRRATHSSLQAFTLWVILVAVRHGCKELLPALYPSLHSSHCAPVQQDHLQSQLHQVTTTLADSFLRGEGVVGPQYNYKGEEETSTRGLSLLCWAIWIDHCPLVNLLMLEGVTATNNPWCKLPPLHIAALYGHDAVAHTVVASSWKDAQTLARETDDQRRTALYHAASYGHEKIAISLLRWGAEIDAVTDTVKKGTALHVAAEQGHLGVVQLLLDNGARVDTSNLNGVTALHVAAQQGYESIVQVLLDNGAWVDTSDRNGDIALHIAAEGGHTGVVQLLLDNGAGVDTSNLNGVTALHVAAQQGYESIVQVLLDNGAGVDTSNLNGVTALHVAAQQGCESIVQVLLDNGARADTPDYASQTALHMAAEGGHTGVVQLLLDKGARRDARDHLRRTPLLLACELKRESVIAMFAKERLDFSFRDGKGRNAWQMALHPSHYCNPCDHGPSQSTFDLIMQSFWAAENPQTMPLPKQRRAIVSFEMEIDTDWTALTLDSRYARFEHPRPLPSHVIDMFGRFIKVCPPAESIESLKSTIEFHVIYACETLDFSTAHEGRDFPRSVDRLLDSAFVAGGDSWHQAAKEFLFKTIRTSRPIRTPKRYLEHSDTGVSAFYTVTREACNEAFRAKSISLHIIPSKDQY